MSKAISIQIDCGNDAFQSSPEGEVARILRNLADRLERQGIASALPCMLHDQNGNTVGSVGVIGFDDDKASGPRSISDDDICGDCPHLQWAMSAGDNAATCAKGWPGQTDADGYVVMCSSMILQPTYESRVRAYERMGMTTSDAQAVVDAEDRAAK